MPPLRETTVLLAIGTALLVVSGLQPFYRTTWVLEVWDTQADMLLALIGALLAEGLLGRLHVRQVEGLRRGPASG